MAQQQVEEKKKFFCREWAFQKLSHCLDQRPISKTCGALLLGGPGCGKTTFCTELCWPTQGPSGRQQRALSRRLLGHHFLSAQHDRSLSLSEFIRGLVTQILNHSTESQRERSIRRRLAADAARLRNLEMSSRTETEKNSENVTQNSRNLDDLNYVGMEGIAGSIEYTLSPTSKQKSSLRFQEEQVQQQQGIYSNVGLSSATEQLLSPQRHLDTSFGAPPIPTLPVNSRTLIADAYLEKLKSDPEIQLALRSKTIEANPDDCLKRALLFPLLEIDPPKTSLFILIDSIDEYSFVYSNSTLTRPKPRERSTQSRTIAELLANHHHLFPQWLLLVCTARKQSRSIAKMFTGFRKLSLDDLRKSQVVRDVQQYILARLDEENSLRQHISRDTAEMLNQLHIKSNGCFLYLEKVLDGVANNFIVLREVKEIPGTLNGLYLWLSQRLFNRKQFAKVQPLLNVILAAKCPLTHPLLFDIIKTYYPTISLDSFNKRFDLLRRILIISKHGTFRLFHHSFGEWLLDIKHCTQKYLCNIFKGHTILAMYYTVHAKSLSVQEIYDYAFHLTRTEQFLVEKPVEECPKMLLKMKKNRLSSETVVNNKHPIKQQKSTVYNNSDLKEDVFSGENSKNSDVKNDLSLNLLLLQNVELNDSFNENSQFIQSPISDFDNKLENEIRNLVSCTVASESEYIQASSIAQNPDNSNLNLKQSESCDQIADEKEESTNKAVPETVEADKNVLDMHTLVLLWIILSGCNVEDCLLDPDASANFGISYPTDQKVLKLLLEAGATEQAEVEDCECESSQLSVATSSEPSPEPLFDLRDMHGQAALHVAARLGQAQLVKVLLDAGADPDLADGDGWTPLRAASWGGHTEVVELLVARGCALDSTDQEGRTALRAASWSGHEDIVRILVTHGAQINLTDHEGRTALIAAAYMGHAEIVEHLLDNGANVNHADADGRTALSVAALCAPSNHGYATVVSILLDRGAGVDHQDREGMTPLLVAAFEGHRDVCELLLEYEADVDHCDHTGRTPLWAAASMGHAPVVALLLFWGCCIDTMDQEGRTVLSVAAAQGCVEVVRLLLDRGLDEQHRDNSGWTPLHYAAFEGHQEVCEALLEAGARVDETDNEGKGALTLAAQGGHTALVSTLLGKHHAPCDQRPHDGKTALRLAALEGHYDVVQLLLVHGADINSKDADGRSTLYVLALDNRLAMAKYLVSQGADVETRDLEGRTPLHVSAWQGHTEMVCLLLSHGRAAVDACDLENRTALHSASWQGHSAIVRLLLEHGAAPDHTCNQGATALGIAAQEGHELCVVALLEHGANPNHSDSCGRNALRVAAKSGHRGVVRLLEDYNIRSHKIAHNSSSTNSITSASTAETKPSTAVLYPGSVEWSEQQRRSCVSLGNHSSNSKSSSNLTGSSHSSRHGGGDRPRDPVPVAPQPMSFTQQLEQCSRGAKTRPLSKLLSPLQSEPQSPIYASPPMSPTHEVPNMFGAMNIYQPVLKHHSNFLANADTHFARDTHMRIILGNSSPGIGSRLGKNVSQTTQDSISNSKPKRNGIVTNPALRLVAGVKNGLDNAAANLRKSASGGNSSNPTTKTHSFQWRKETPL